MKKRTAYIMKRFICLILMLLVCFNVSIMAHASNSDKDGVIKSGDYKYTLLDDGTAKLVEMLVGDKITFEIPSEIDGYTVTAIGGSVYPYSKVNKVIIPSSLTIIENNPFKDMECLVEIEVSPDHPTFAVINDVLFRKADKCLVCFPGGRTGNLVDNIYSIPEGIEVIGDCAFSRCKASKIIIPESVITIGDYAFQFSELKSIAIPKSVKSIGNNPFLFQEWAENNKIDLTVSPDNPYFYFSENTLFDKEGRIISYLNKHDIRVYTVPDGIKIIGAHAFDHASLEDVRLPKGLEQIQDNAFEMCMNLENVKVSDGLKNIGSDAFHNCLGIREIVLPDGLEEIGDHAFAGCEYLVSVTVPDSVLTIGESAFSACESLKNMSLPPSLTSIPSGAFFNCSSLKSVMIPDGVTLIGTSAFWGAESLEEVYIPETVTEIGRMAFEHCSSLYSINYDGKMSRLPSSVTVIGEDAFRDCPLLNMLYLPRSISFMDEGVFYGDINLIANVERNSYAAEYCEQNGVTYTYPDSLDWLSN